MTKSAKTALGGIIAALSVTVMLLTVIPAMTYVSPMVAGVLLTLIVIEADKKWAFGVYAVTAVLSILLAGDKEAAIIYATFFGYYPIIKAFIESVKSRALTWVIKFAVFNAAAVGSYLLMVYVLGLPIEGLNDFGKWSIPIILGAGNIAFVFYDRFFLTAFVTLYVNRWQERFRKLFRVKK